MTQIALTSDGRPVNAAAFAGATWEELKRSAKLGEFVMACCATPAVLKTSINGVAFFAHLSDECATAPETVWHKTGKAAILAALRDLGANSQEEMSGNAPNGQKWKADVLFCFEGRTIAIELQRSYQHLRDFLRRQERYAASAVECYWLLQPEVFTSLSKATARRRLQRDFGNVFPEEGIGTGALPELPVSMLAIDSELRVIFGGLKSASVNDWLTGIFTNEYQFRNGSWNLN